MAQLATANTPSFGEGSISNEDRLGNTHQAATTLPAFGSVTQSRNSNVSGITTDVAETTFTGDRFTLKVTREDGSFIYTGYGYR